MAAFAATLVHGPTELRGMRRLLTDDDLIATLQRAARHRPSRTWDDYGRELWATLAAAQQEETP